MIKENNWLEINKDDKDIQFHLLNYGELNIYQRNLNTDDWVEISLNKEELKEVIKFLNIIYSKL